MMHVADSSVKIKITEQKDALKPSTFQHVAVSSTDSIFTTAIGRKQGKKGEEITLQICSGGNRCIQCG